MVGRARRLGRSQRAPQRRGLRPRAGQESEAVSAVASAKAALADPRTATAGRRAPIPDDVKAFVWQRDRGRCGRCGSNENLKSHHVIPLSMGGANTARNLQVLCKVCNRAKGGNLV